MELQEKGICKVIWVSRKSEEKVLWQKDSVLKRAIQMGSWCLFNMVLLIMMGSKKMRNGKQRLFPGCGPAPEGISMMDAEGEQEKMLLRAPPDTPLSLITGEALF